ncbi:hypothetical protein H671_4g11632 [Cricetulus griseus]|uniref:Uncharacterized protein n=1 Tax=Cricetulus griseus TaxID=10029 RepID=A0A061I9E3_CRIGR|nr:hypothetical protein H671_4g11632 [Cricetulus griseus]
MFRNPYECKQTPLTFYGEQLFLNTGPDDTALNYLQAKLHRPGMDKESKAEIPLQVKMPKGQCFFFLVSDDMEARGSSDTAPPHEEMTMRRLKMLQFVYKPNPV